MNHTHIIHMSLLGVLALTLGCSGPGVDGDDEFSWPETGDDSDYIDQVPCGPKECVASADCCESMASAGALYGHMACASTSQYTKRWSCVEGECVNAGCDTQHPCPPDFECHPVDSVNYCIQPCVVDSDCHLKIGNPIGTTFCDGQTDDDKKYCIEQAP